MTSNLRKIRKEWKPFLLQLTPARIALLYAAAGCLWIAFSDTVLSAFVHDVNMITLISLIKGWLYVAVTAVILYLLIRRAEATLRESEKKFRMLADTAAAAIFIYRDSGFLYVNSQSQRLTGYTQEELLRMNFWDVVHPDHRDMVRERGTARLQGGYVPPQYEFKIITKGGKERWVDFTSGTIEFEGRPAALGTAYDITERRNLEEQLLQSQKMEAIGLLAGGVAHDFNNILTAIIGYGNLVKQKISADDVRHHVDQILKSADRAARLTHGLLAFSRKQVLDPKPVDINEIIVNVGKLLVRLIGEDIDLKLVLSPECMTVLADSGQIEQVLMNLATNARDAMPRGGSLTIATKRMEIDDAFIKLYGYGSPGEYAVVTVADTGEGMERKRLDRIFDPFFTTKETGKGTGLGLAIVYGIIKQHDGFISVASEPGKGSSFSVSLRLLRPRECEDEAHLPDEAPRGGSETVLLAEDDESVRTLTKTVLAEAGYTVITASEGEEALAKFSNDKDRITLLLLDVIMPKKNGREVREEALRMRPGIKTLFISGYAGDVFRKDAGPDAGLNFIAKPVSPTELLRKIRETLDD
jgi:PAS domain S-box-containing protein